MFKTIFRMLEDWSVGYTIRQMDQWLSKWSKSTDFEIAKLVTFVNQERHVLNKQFAAEFLDPLSVLSVDGHGPLPAVAFCDPAGAPLRARRTASSAGALLRISAPTDPRTDVLPVACMPQAWAAGGSALSHPVLHRPGLRHRRAARHLWRAGAPPLSGRDRSERTANGRRQRIGVNVGDIIIDDGDIFGDGVNIAARLEALCEPGGLCISRAANEQIRDKLALAFADLGEQIVKNISRAIGVYGLAPTDIEALPEPEGITT